MRRWRVTFLPQLVQRRTWPVQPRGWFSPQRGQSVIGSAMAASMVAGVRFELTTSWL